LAGKDITEFDTSAMVRQLPLVVASEFLALLQHWYGSLMGELYCHIFWPNRF